MSKRKSNGTTFKRGRRKTGGRRLGVPNRNTRVLREAVLLAAVAAGSEKGKNGLYLYLKKVAKKQPAIFLPLLGRLLPLQVESQQTSKTEVTYRSAAEIHQELARRGVPVDRIFSEQTSFAKETEAKRPPLGPHTNDFEGEHDASQEHEDIR